MLLILTSDKDLTADFLIVELIDRGLPYFRLNAEQLTSADYSFSISGDGVRRELGLGRRSLCLDDVTAVWYRRAIQPGSISELPPAERIFVAGELRHLATGLILNPAITWVNPVDRVYVAEHKLLQLQLARKIGFRVPRTLVSRDPTALRKFVEANKTGSICKPIFHGMFVDGEDCYSVYTRRVSPDSFDADSVKVCPVLLQEEIPRQADVRATFIGAHCFVADITADSNIVDWRDPNVSARYSEATLTDDIMAKCRAMLSALGLLYGAFDFLRTPEGDLVFLEVNPTGEWAWLEDRLGFAMRKAFIELFFGVGA
jgi:hypothetical protein